MCEHVDKVDLLSEATAANMVTLHKLAAPGCTTIEAYPCGDHFHVGHDGRTTEGRAAAVRCKTDHPFTRPHRHRGTP